jgi:hypothetical protein
VVVVVEDYDFVESGGNIITGLTRTPGDAEFPRFSLEVSTAWNEKQRP